MPQFGLPVLPTGLNFVNIAATGTTVVKSSPAMFGTLIVNSATAGSVVTIFDNTAGSGTIIASFTLAAITNPQPPVQYNIRTTKGLTIVVSADNCDLTVTFN